MHLAVGGIEESSGDPFIMSAGGQLDQQIFPGPVDKDRIEDLQVWSAMQALAFWDVLCHPLSIQPGDDPPDRVISCGNRTWGVELTELTIQDVRQDLAPVRTFGRKLQERLREQSDRFPHLRGRVVQLTKQRDHAVPRQFIPMLEEIERALEEDKGYFGEGSDWSAGVPQHIGDRGQYGDHGAFHILVNRTKSDDPVQVSATSQFEIYRSKALAALEARITAKDKPGNDIIVVTCGLPDRQGYACPTDHDLFNVLREAAKENVPTLAKPLAHAHGALIHLWGSNEIYALTETDDVPWSTSAPNT